MYSRGGLCCHKATTLLNWAVIWPQHNQERHPVSPSIVAPVLPLSLLYCKSCLHDVLGLEVDSQWPPCKVFYALGEVDSLPLSLLVVPPHPQHQTGKGFVCPYPERLSCIAYYPHYFFYICLQPHLIKTRQRVKCSLEPPWFCGGYHPIVWVDLLYILHHHLNKG